MILEGFRVSRTRWSTSWRRGTRAARSWRGTRRCRRCGCWKGGLWIVASRAHLRGCRGACGRRGEGDGCREVGALLCVVQSRFHAPRFFLVMLGAWRGLDEICPSLGQHSSNPASQRARRPAETRRAIAVGFRPSASSCRRATTPCWRPASSASRGSTNPVRISEIVRQSPPWPEDDGEIATCGATIATKRARKSTDFAAPRRLYNTRSVRSDVSRATIEPPLSRASSR